MNSAAIKFDGKNRYIRITDIDESSSGYKSDSPVSPDGELLDKYLVQENDILFARTGASTGKTYLYNVNDGKLYFAGFLIRARIDKDYNAAFVFAQTQTIAYNRWVKLMSMRSGQPGINSQEYASFQFKIPPRKEQDKIATFLSLIGDRIQTQSKLIIHYQSLIQNLRDKIFKQKLSFEDDNGNNFSDWEVKKLGDILTIGSGRDYKHLEKGDIPVFGTGGLMTYVNSFLYEGETVCIGRKGTIDKPMYYEGKIWTVDTLFYSHSFLNTVPKFIFHIFKMINWKEYNEASGVPSLSKSTIEKIEINIPSLHEQTKIAEFLSKIDEKIETEKEVLTQYENQKKYLLQNLFI